VDEYLASWLLAKVKVKVKVKGLVFMPLKLVKIAVVPLF
jgi:hypothetical protein